jgi:hypothetical protein
MEPARAAHAAHAADSCRAGCPHARRFTDSIARLPSAHVFNEVVLNQLFVRIPELLAHRALSPPTLTAGL